MQGAKFPASLSRAVEDQPPRCYFENLAGSQWHITLCGRSLLLLVPSLAWAGFWRGSPGLLRNRTIVGAWETGQNKAIDPKKSGCLKEQCLYQHIGSFWDPQIPALYRLDRGLGH